MGPIVIVGGRVAGLVTAALLARNGEDVVIIERARLGAPTVSIAMICPDTLAIFDEIGFASHLDTSGLTRIRQLSFEVIPGVRISGSFPHSYGRSWGYAIRRELLDIMLQRHVIAKYPNITWIDSFHVNSLLSNGERIVGIEGTDRDGLRRHIEGDLIIGADGKFSTVAKLAASNTIETGSLRTFFYYAYFQAEQPNFDAGTLCTHHGAAPFPLVAFSQDAENGLIGVGLQGSQRRFPEFKRDVTNMFLQCTKMFPALQERLNKATLASNVTGLLIPAMRKRQPWGAGWALVGDAATHINPITGQGISFATRAAIWLSESIRNWRNGQNEDEALTKYSNRLSSEFHADYNRAAAVADIEAPIEGWRQQCYAWMARNHHCVDLWLQLLTNAISIRDFEEKSCLAEVERKFRPPDKMNHR